METTGLSPNHDLIVELGIVELDLTTEKTIVIFDTLIKEFRFSEEFRYSWIFENSDLTFEEVKEAPEFDNISHDIQLILNNYQITAFNKAFDLGFLKARGLTIPHELPCIMITATNIVKIEAPWKNGPEKFKWPKVEEAWNFFFPNINYDEKHRAADDAIHEAQILNEIIKMGLFFE
ncbi:MAG: 3'-5' exonuclease [Promethearchaeota archaeon]